jgi:predicted nucleotidyltransferase
MSDNSQCYLQSYGCTSKEAIVSAIVGAKMQMKKDYGVTAVWLFGSFATDEADEFSDVDLLISGSGRRRGESLGLIANAYRSLLHRPIDVHYEDGPWLGDRSSLKKERVLLYDDH